MKESRTRSIILNSTITLIGQVLQVLIGFVVRKLFISYLGVVYLGYNSVFTNILQMLNLADMGIGVAVTSFLYKPLAEKDEPRVKALMFLYRKVYECIGVVVLLLGVVISFFLPVIIPDAQCSQEYLAVFFYINLVSTVSTYYLAFKRTLIIADQKSYIVSAVDTISSLVFSIIQIVLLICAPNYFLYLIVFLLRNIISNIILSVYSDRKYGKIGNQRTNEYLKWYKPQIIDYIKDVFISRIGAYIYYSTDNIVISIFRGSLLTGYLSNYTLVTMQITSLMNQVLSSIQATFGNYISVNEDIKKQETMADNYLCANYIVGNFCFLCFSFLIQPFIGIIFGEQYKLGTSTVILLSVNLMLTIMIQLPSQLFMIYKMYHYDRPIIITSALLNIIISCALVKPLGIDGVLIGTLITSLIYLFSRYFVISRFVYKNKYSHYLRTLLIYVLISIASLGLIYCSANRIEGTTLITFVCRMIIVGLLAILLPSSFLVYSGEFEFLIDKFIPFKLHRFISKRLIISASLFFLVISAVLGGWISNIPSKFTQNDTNKSLPREGVVYYESSFNERYFHFSVDDFIFAFKDITENEGSYNSIFDNSTFAWLREIHNKYGIVITCYVYYEEDDFSLANCTQKFRQEFFNNADWLRFGFHTKNKTTIYGENDQEIINDYLLTVRCLQKIVSDAAIDSVIRLQSFQASKKQIDDLKNSLYEPISGLFTADDARTSYFLSEEDNEYIYDHDYLFENDLIFISTDLRAELVKNPQAKISEFKTEAWKDQLGILALFSHEWALNGEVKECVEVICNYANEEGYQMKFIEDIITDLQYNNNF